MKRPSPRLQTNFPFPYHVVTGALLLTVALLLGGSYLMWELYQMQTRQAESGQQVEAIRLQVDLRGRRLNLYRRLALLTGNPTWQSAFETAYDSLNTVLSHAEALAPSAYHRAGAQLADSANQALYAIERRAVGAAVAGRRAEADSLMGSAAYAAALDDYDHGLLRMLGSHDRALLLRHLHDQLAAYDELMAAQARLATRTPADDADRQYDLLEATRQGLFNDIALLAPEIPDEPAYAATHEARTAVATLEHRLYDLVRQGQADRARTLLDSPAYADAHRALGEARAALGQALGTEVQRLETTRHRRGLLYALCVGGVLALLLGIWVVVWRMVRRHLAERRHTLATLHQSEANNRSLVAALPDAMYLLDAEGRVIDRRIPPAGLALAPEALFATPAFRDHLACALREGRAVRFEHEQTGDGPPRFAEARLVPYGPERILLILRDVTEVRGAARAIAEAEARYRSLVEQSLVGIYLIQDGRFVYVNPRMAEMLGYTPDELRTLSSILDVIHPDDQEKVADNVRRRLEGDITSAHYDVRGFRKDGGLIHGEVFGSVTEFGGRPAILGSLLDVTNQKEAEARLVAAKEEAEEMARLKSAFLANMSHEIRTPLTAILGFAAVLEEEVPDEFREFGTVIQRSGERLLATINAVLDLSRLEAGELKLAPRPVDAAREVRDTALLLEQLAEKKGLALHLDLPEGETPAALDPSGLHMLLNNLVGNAVKFTERGHVRVGLAATDETLTLQIEDTGVGIDAGFLPSLFEEFKQESTGMRRSHEGSGLGLAITQRVVALMGGAISVESEKGQGSTFTVELPRYAAVQDAAGDGGGATLETSPLPAA